MPTHQQNLQSVFGFEVFRPGQAEVIGHLDAEKRALAIFPTGGGKSLCYELPALAYTGLTLVVSPLIALMEQQASFLNSKGVAAVALTSGVSADAERQIRERARRQELRLLYVAPERFNNERFRGLLQQLPIALFAVDEAHCISEWGHNFRPDYLKLAQAARECRAERILALTATATPRVAEDICAAFGIPPQAVVRTGFHRPNLSLSTTPTPAAAREAVLLERLQSRPRGTTIVYVTRQETAARLAARLAEAGLPARHYHAGMESPARTETQAWWLAGQDRIVVATIAFGMGIDKADVRYVYHYNLPKSLEAYSQEIGRAGRDGAPAVVELLAGAEDVRSLENFAYGDTPSREAMRRLLGEVLAGGPDLQVGVPELAGRLDLRKEVVETALTYLQLDGWLEQKTPVYLGYELKFLQDRAAALATFDAARRSFLERVFAQAKKGRIWLSLNPAVVGNALGEDRERVVKALDYLAEKGVIELRAADVRARYRRLRDPTDRPALVEALAVRFERREQSEVGRIQEMLALVVSPNCQANQLADRFGEVRTTPCGQCSACRSIPRTVTPLADPGPLAAALPPTRVAALQREAEVLRDPRSLARFLCGLSSPGLTRAKLQKHPQFAALEAWPFAAVLAHVEMPLPAR